MGWGIDTGGGALTPTSSSSAQSSGSVGGNTIGGLTFAPKGAGEGIAEGIKWLALTAIVIGGIRYLSGGNKK